MTTWDAMTANNPIPALDDEGFLLNLADWSESIAVALANNEGITLTPQHWEIIHLVREYHAQFDMSPAMRPLVKYAGIKLGTEKGKSIYLMTLFPGSPAKIASKIGGLPKPDNCL